MILPILIHPNQILRNISVEIPEVTDEIRVLARDMMETMTRADGIGLAAPQIGKNVRLFIAGNKSKTALINPVITKRSFRKDVMEEGCLSIPGVIVQVKRHVSITVEYIDLKGEKRVLDKEGFLARVIQHEIDHLDGILIIDKVEM